MFELTREILMYVLVGLTSILLVLVFLILRKRGMFGGKRWDEAPKPTPEETGPTDHGAIKEKLKSDKGADIPRPPGPTAPPSPRTGKPPEEDDDEDVPLPEEPAKKMKFPFGQKDGDDDPFPVEPGDEEGLDKEEPLPGDAEEGVELGDEEVPRPERRDARAREPDAMPPMMPSAPPYRKEPRGKSDDSADLGGREDEKTPPKPEKAEDERTGLMRKFARAVKVSGSDERPPKAKAAGEKEEPEEPKSAYAPAPARKPEPPAPRGEPLSTADIMKSPQGFRGHTVSLEGDMKLSSKGAEDAWYILFDGRGSVVVRSKEEIQGRRAKILAKVEQTRLGQVYLDVISYEKA